MYKHHVIYGHGKRKACETRDSLVDICHSCHKLVHSTRGVELDRSLRLNLQALYFKKGLDEVEVQELMGGKLLQYDGQIYRY